jgi:hypothetical protein
MSKRPALDPVMLAQFTGSQNFYRHRLLLIQALLTPLGCLQPDLQKGSNTARPRLTKQG